MSVFCSLMARRPSSYARPSGASPPPWMYSTNAERYSSSKVAGNFFFRWVADFMHEPRLGVPQKRVRHHSRDNAVSVFCQRLVVEIRVRKDPRQILLEPHP